MKKSSECFAVAINKYGHPRQPSRISNPLRMRSISRAGFKMAAVGRWLESRHVYVQTDWLEACINFVREDNEVLKLCIDIVCNLTAKTFQLMQRICRKGSCPMSS